MGSCHDRPRRLQPRRRKPPPRGTDMLESQGFRLSRSQAQEFPKTEGSVWDRRPAERLRLPFLRFPSQIVASLFLFSSFFARSIRKLIATGNGQQLATVSAFTSDRSKFWLSSHIRACANFFSIRPVFQLAPLGDIIWELECVRLTLTLQRCLPGCLFVECAVGGALEGALKLAP